MEQLSKPSTITPVIQTEDNTPQCDDPQKNDREVENSVPNIISALEKHFRKYYNNVNNKNGA